MAMNKLQVKNYGCRINAYEAEIIKEIIRGDDNVIVLNTCTVTAEAHRQCLQGLRKLRKENPHARIIVTGCASTVLPEDFTELADVIVHNDRKTIPSSYIAGAADEPMLITGVEERNRAFLQVQHGCDYKCTYCIVPKARGASRSVPYDRIHEQITSLLATGVKEIVLTGINLSDYDGGIAPLAERILADFPKLRLRLSSLDPAKIDDAVIELFRKGGVLPHLHLSIQAGDNTTLKRMGRRHRREDIIKIAEKIHDVCSDIMLGADFITGFPMESEEDFANTCRLVEEAGLSLLHVFPYSERPSTAATKLPPVDKNVRKNRAEILRNIGAKALEKKLRSLIGHTLNVLLETDSRGHSDNFIMVNTSGKAGELVRVKIGKVQDGELWGEIV